MRFCESFGHISLNITRSEKCAEKTNVAEEERDTQFMCSTSFVLALCLLRQRYVSGSEREGLLGVDSRRNRTQFTDCQILKFEKKKNWKPHL